MTYTKLSGNTSPMVLTDGNGGHYESLIGRANVVRRGMTLYRQGLTTSDRVSPLIDGTLADVATGGSLLANTNYKFAHCPESDIELGTGKTNATSLTTANDGSNTHVMRVTLSQCFAATAYHLFCSTATNPVYVAKITEAQRAAGCTITAYCMVDATSPGAGIIDIRVPGASSISLQNSPFGVGTSRGPTSLDGYDPIDCTGYNYLHVTLVHSADDLGTGTAFPACAVYGLIGDKYYVINNFSQSVNQEGPIQSAITTVTGLTAVKIAHNTLPSSLAANPNQSLDIYYELY